MLKGLNAGSPFVTNFPGTSIGQQLKQVAQIIKLRATTGMRRQVFFCSVGGFDTHGAQSWQQWDLFKQISDAMNSFYLSTQELGVANDVTTFTESEFGRSLQPSGSGSDHGWGSHFLVMGGDLYGQFPDLSLGGPDDSGNRGTFAPNHRARPIRSDALEVVRRPRRLTQRNLPQPEKLRDPRSRLLRVTNNPGPRLAISCSERATHHTAVASRTRVFEWPRAHAQRKKAPDSFKSSASAVTVHT